MLNHWKPPVQLPNWEFLSTPGIEPRFSKRLLGEPPCSVLEGRNPPFEERAGGLSLEDKNPQPA